MPRQPRLVQLPLVGKIFLCVLAGVYVVYLVALARFLYSSGPTSSTTIIEHSVEMQANTAIQHWTVANMRGAINADLQIDSSAGLTQGSSDTSPDQAVQHQGQPQQDASSPPLSTVGKVFFTNASGQNMVCSGTAVESSNKSVVDTAGHCLFWNGDWVNNVIFCPLYDNGNTPYGCWAAQSLEVPNDWIEAGPNDLHHDFGMAIVSPNNHGLLTDVVGGAGWAYNQPTDRAFYAYGYPAAYPFDGQTRQSCEDARGTFWEQHAGGTVVSIPCNMTGGSSGGPWFVQIDGKWYLNGHNDFTSSIKPGHMFSPYYDETWHALYEKAQHD
ncbi:MAG: hypothetical protein J2P37_32515 [Ktedonobacteraceae bacterium]|nr:hypothetical protein [Ktedonobacteraceae bacterium]